MLRRIDSNTGNQCVNNVTLLCNYVTLSRLVELTFVLL